MTGVLDVSGAVEILLHKEKAEKFNNVLQESGYIIAPDLYVSELANTLWKYYSLKNLSLDICTLYIQKGIALVDKFIDSNVLWQEVFSESVKNGHSVYDMFYMVAARRNSGILITSDSVLAGICKKNRIQLCY